MAITNKQHALDRVGARYTVYHKAVRDVDADRLALAEAMVDAKNASATQEEIASQTNFSRQRVQQLIKESRS